MVSGLGAVLMLAVGYVYVASGLVVPGPWVLLLWALWIVMARDAWRHRRRPWRVLATPVVAAVVWVVVVSLGGALLGWTA